MTEFAGRTAVVTGGGSGMGRELVRQLVADACNVVMCDVSPTGLAETQRLCEAAGLPQGCASRRTSSMSPRDLSPEPSGYPDNAVSWPGVARYSGSQVSADCNRT